MWWWPENHTLHCRAPNSKCTYLSLFKSHWVRGDWSQDVKCGPEEVNMRKELCCFERCWFSLAEICLLLYGFSSSLALKWQHRFKSNSRNEFSGVSANWAALKRSQSWNLRSDTLTFWNADVLLPQGFIAVKKATQNCSTLPPVVSLWQHKKKVSLLTYIIIQQNNTGVNSHFES